MNNKTKQSVMDVLPCPFCGSTEGFYVEEGRTFHWRVISCRNCGEGTKVRHKNNSNEPDSYITDWNAAAPYTAMLRNGIDTLRARLAKAQKDAERLDWIDRQTQLPATPRGQPWIIGHTTIFGLDFRDAIDATKGESNG